MHQSNNSNSEAECAEREAFLFTDSLKTEDSSEPIPRWDHGGRGAHDRIPWIISTVVLAVLLTISLANQFFLQASPISCSPRGDEADLTDIEDGRQAIAYERQRYTGSLTWDYSKSAAVRVLDAEVQYFGSPSPDLDGNWKNLLRGEFPIIYEDEKPDYITEENRLWDGYFHFEPDFFHNLHCLNAIRRHMQPLLYPDVPYGFPDLEDEKNAQKLLGPEWKRHHMEHCMDRIRQGIMCHGDMTPSIMHRWNNSGFALGQTGERLCRKFEPIREWMDNRAARDNRTIAQKVD